MVLPSGTLPDVLKRAVQTHAENSVTFSKEVQMKKKTGENRLASFVEQRLDLIANHLVSVVRSEHPDELRSLVHKWLTNHVACCSGKLCHVSEWAAQTVDVFEKQGAGIEEAHRIFRLCRKELIDYCLDNAEEVPGQEVYAQIMEASDLHEAQLVDYCSRLMREQEAAARRKGGIIVEAISYPLALLNAQGFIEIVNRPFARSLGVTPESLTGCDMLALCDSKTVNRMKTALRHRAGSKQIKAFEGALQSGKLRVEARFTIQPLFDRSGFRSGAVLSMETNAPAIADSSDTMVYIEDMLLTALPFPIQVLNEKREVTYSSESIRTVAPEGYDEREPLCCMLYRRRYGGQRPCLCRQAAETAQFHLEEFSCPGADETRWFMVMALPVPDGSGNVKRTITCTYDQTRRKQIQKQLEMEVIVQQRSSLMPQIAVTVAHQLRNPLSVVLGFAEMLAKGMPPNQTGEAVNRILRNAIRCKEIVEELLNFGKGMPQERRVLDFSTLVTESVRPLLTSSQSRIIEWHLPEASVLVECIPEQLTQAVFSLLDNALRYAESRVVCTLEVKGDAAKLRVVDDGPGIPLQNQDRIFEPFFTTRRESGALGLGLSLARAVANDCGGSLAIASAASDEPRGHASPCRCRWRLLQGNREKQVVNLLPISFQPAEYS